MFIHLGFDRKKGGKKKKKSKNKLHIINQQPNPKSQCFCLVC